MPTRSERVIAGGMELTPRGRTDPGDIRGANPHSVDEVEAAWDAEVTRRGAEVDSGSVQCVSWDIVMAELRATLR